MPNQSVPISLSQIVEFYRPGDIGQEEGHAMISSEEDGCIKGYGSHIWPLLKTAFIMVFKFGGLRRVYQGCASCIQIARPIHTLIPVFPLVAFLLVGCASTTVTTTGVPLKEPLCQASKRPIPTLVYWGTKWRPDQKEPELREAAAMRGIQDFLSRSGCLLVLAVNRLAPEQAQASDEELMHSTSNANSKPDRIVRIVVRELGPRLLIGIPVVVEGGTEVVVDVRVLDATTSELLVNTQTTWRNGGSFVIKGIKTLEHDMSAALAATLMVNGH